VERARKEGAGADRRRAALESTYRFANAMAGDRPGFEEAVRALYAGDLARFDSLAAAWPFDIAAHAIELAGRSLPGPEGTD
jgi:hypothetical protein